jgi:hypothetical protein
MYKKISFHEMVEQNEFRKLAVGLVICNLADGSTWLLITEATRSKAWNVFARSNIGIVGSNPSQSMDDCLLLFSIYVR